MTDQPEYLDSRGGAPGVPAPARRRRHRPVIAAAGVLGLAAVGGGAWAAWSFFSTGPQPAEALPDSTIAYASVDLDPSGGQKIEALRTLSEFPAFEDHVGLRADDDVRAWAFDQIAGAAGCDLDYADEIEPWLGDRMAAAAVDSDDEQPDVVFVLQVADESGADDGLEALAGCSGPDVGWTIRDGWAIVAENQEVADAVADAASDAPLSDDADFSHWTDEAGDSGILSMYAAPALGPVLADQLDFGIGSALAGGGIDSGAAYTTSGDDLVPPETFAALEDFPGAAATLRFDDGGLELEVAGGSLGDDRAPDADGAGDAVSALPDTTVAAFGLGLYDGWADDVVDRMGVDGASLLAEASQATGLELPGDAERLLGDAVAVAVDQDFDPGALAFSPEAGEAAPTGVGARILGDPAEIESVLDRLRATAAGSDGGLLDDSAGDGVVAVGTDDDYRSRLAEDGDLGDSDAFRDVVEHADDASAILFVDLGAVSWLDDAGLPDEVRANLEPLDALGLSAWFEDDTPHALLKVTTD